MKPLATFIAWFIAALALFVAPASAQLACWGEISAGKEITASKIKDVAGTVVVSASGLQGGVGIGCDVTREQFVIGALARFDISDLSGGLSGVSIDSDGAWTVAARAGIKPNSSSLIYAVLGWHQSDISYSNLVNINSQGLLYGAGLEIDAFFPNLSVFVEWTHSGGESRFVNAFSLKPESDVIRIGTRFRFSVPAATSP